MCLTRQRDYPAEPSAIAGARDFVAALVVAMLDPSGWSVADDASLLASELVTQAVQAGCSHLEVLTALHADRLEIAVTGHGADAASAASWGPANGRSLRDRLIDDVADSAGFRCDPDGTLVATARLSCRVTWTAGVPCAFRRGRPAS